MSDSDRLFDVVLDDAGLPPPSPEQEQERRVAVFDLAEKNSFALCDHDAPVGPYALRLSVEGNRLRFDLSAQNGAAAGEFEISLVKFRRVARDYFQICASYSDAVKRLPPAQIERIDEARRLIHEEGAQTLMASLADHARIDAPTARRLFTLVCVLFPKPD